MDSSSGAPPEFDYLFKLLLIGDYGVGKSTLLRSFTSDAIGVDFKVKNVTLGGKKLKLAIWDTAGQERFRTMNSSYYRGAQGVIMVYDVTRRETFTNLSDIWAKEIDLYSTNQDCIKMLVGNKVDKESERVVSKKEGIDFAREYGCLFIECGAKTRLNMERCFEELVVQRMSYSSESISTHRYWRHRVYWQKVQILRKETYSNRNLQNPVHLPAVSAESTVPSSILFSDTSFHCHIPVACVIDLWFNCSMFV